MLVLCFVLCPFVLSFLCAAPNESEMVWLTDVTRRLPTVKRDSSDPSLPDNLTFQLRGGSRSLTLNLKRNNEINPNADMYFVRKSNDGQSHLEKALNLENEDVAYYQDWQNGAFMTVRCVRRSDGQCNRVIVRIF
ncbi:hypothetical protein ACJMK2_038116 [Sinanodonta woodiana]|uniref:Uncharacterized protein n=1 Tax=Sinanodonta woodiana TaxID=1069815 RepID=A0ABD3WMJ4_SINWO